MKHSLPSRHLLPCLVLSLGLLTSVGARAQEELPDAGYYPPDASGGGEQPSNPEGDDDDDGVGRPAGACRSTSDCSPRFSCSQGKCRYTGIREAERVGCLFGPADTLAVVGLGLVVARWRRGVKT
jgi:hypothetical protein